MTYSLYLDDVRKAPEGAVLVRTVSEFKAAVRTRGVPEAVSFDHDLGEEETGRDALDWLLAQGLDLSQTRMLVHSANIVASIAMTNVIIGYRRYCEEHGVPEQGWPYLKRG